MSTATEQPTTRPQKVVGFERALKRYFRKRRNNVVSGNVDKPRERGRWALAYAMRDMGFREGVEVGTQYGISAEMWCSANPQLHLTCIDPYAGYHKLGRRKREEASFEKTSEYLSLFNVTMVHDFSLNVVSGFADESLDFVHIDGNHSFDNCMADLIVWVPKVKKGGLVLVHDYSSINWNGVTQAVNDYLGAHKISPWYATFEGASTAFWQRGAERE